MLYIFMNWTTTFFIANQPFRHKNTIISNLGDCRYKLCIQFKKSNVCMSNNMPTQYMHVCS